MFVAGNTTRQTSLILQNRVQVVRDGSYIELDGHREVHVLTESPDEHEMLVVVDVEMGTLPSEDTAEGK
jgi:hypothetical protein